MWHQALDTVTEEVWANIVQNVNQIIEEAWRNEHIIDKINPVIVNRADFLFLFYYYYSRNL